MKFSILAQALLAVPVLSAAIAPPAERASTVKRQSCNLTLQWTGNWSELGLRRYRVQLITSPRNDQHLDIYCSQFRSRPLINNPQCFWTDNVFVVDGSFVEGSLGYTQYLEAHNGAATGFARATGCSVTRNL